MNRAYVMGLTTVCVLLSHVEGCGVDAAVRPDAGAVDGGIAGRAGGPGSANGDAGAACKTVRNPRTFPDAGPCDDSEVLFQVERTPISKSYMVDCEAQDVDAGGCLGVPNDIWSSCALRRCAPRASYPVGCTVILPTENPYYPGSGQPCSCGSFSPGRSGPSWLCGL